MNILVFVDLHGDRRRFERLKEKSRDADIILCAGDITVFENELSYYLRELEKLKKFTLIIHGNHESEETLYHATKNLKYVKFIHKKIFKFKEFYFFGWGGGGFSQIDNEFEKKKNEYEKILKNSDFIMITHGPPYNTVLDFVNASHVGNKSLRDFIEKNQPQVCVCGHLHENAKKKERIGRTLVVNPGADGVIVKV